MAATTPIIITVYNRERYLSAAIESILAQTESEFELLIWDDGSTDNSVKIAQYYASRDRRIRVVAAEHLGRAPSLQAAHAQANGIYVGWLDRDDLIAPTALEETVSVLNAHPEVGLVYTDHLIIDALNKVLGYGQRCRIPYSKNQLLVDFMTFHFRLLRRKAFDACGGIDLSFKVAVDYDLCLRLSEVTQVKHINKPLYYYRHHKESVSHQQRIEQILASKEAIARALQRRGLSDR